MKEEPKTARDMIYTLPQRLLKEKVEDQALHRFHLKLDGPTGGNFTVTLKNKKVVVLDGLVDEPTCEIKASAKDFEDLQRGKGNPALMFMMGKIKVSDLGEVLRFVEYFDKIHPY